MIAPTSFKEYWTPPTYGWVKWNTDASRIKRWQSTTIALCVKMIKDEFAIKQASLLVPYVTNEDFRNPRSGH